MPLAARVAQIMKEKSLDNKAALKQVARERGITRARSLQAAFDYAGRVNATPSTLTRRQKPQTARRNASTVTENFPSPVFEWCTAERNFTGHCARRG